MESYWDGRYQKEGKIWGDRPSVTASYACDVFLKNGVKRLLIPGIGYGRNARVFVEAGLEVEGIEVSGEAVNILRKDFPGIKCQAGSVLDVPLHGGRYGAIYCFNVLHLLRSGERDAFLAKCLAALEEDGLAYFAVFSDQESSFGKGREVEPGTFESKPGRPVHYFTEGDIRSHFKDFIVKETGLVEDTEDHGTDGRHVHALRYVLAQKRSIRFDGERYKNTSSHQKEWGDRVISGLRLRGGERILDIGCGDGALSERLASRVPRGSVLGIDASASMVATAKTLERDNLRFRLLDANDLDAEEEFDVIFSNATLHWIKGHRRLLSNAFRALKDGGILRLNFAGAGNCPNFNATIKEAIARPEFSEFFAGFEWPWYMPEASDYGALVGEYFRDARIWVENADSYFTEEGLVGFIEQPAILPFIRYVDEQKRPGFRDFVVGRMLERTGQADGRYFEEFRRINVLAHK